MEVRKEIKMEEKKSSLILENRKRLSLNGIIEVISFNDLQIILNTNLGTLTVKGEGLRMNKLDVQNGEAVITGSVNSCFYTGTEGKKDREGVFAKLFR